MARTEEGKVDVMSTDQIRQMMANARKEIEMRRQKLSAIEGKSALVGPILPSQQKMPQPAMDDKAKAVAALQAQIASRMSKISDKLPMPEKPTPVILNSSGQTVDASGQAIQLAQHVPTLKANLRAKKKDEMKEHVREGQGQAAAIQEAK